MSNKNDLIPLLCKQCGAPLQMESDKFFNIGNSVVIKQGEKLHCNHCGTDHLPGEEVKKKSRGDITIKGNVSGSIINTGNGNFIVKN